MMRPYSIYIALVTALASYRALKPLELHKRSCSVVPDKLITCSLAGQNLFRSEGLVTPVQIGRQYVAVSVCGIMVHGQEAKVFYTPKLGHPC